MKYAFIERHKLVWPIRVQCRVLRASVSGFHQHRVRSRQIAQRRHLSDEALLVHISAVYAENRGAYGWPRIWRELRRQGIRVGKLRVQRLMQKHGIQARGKRRFRVVTTDSKHSFPVAANVLDRKFIVAAPNQGVGWRSDVYRDRRRLVVSCCSHRSVQPQSGGLVDAAGYAAQPGDRCSGDGLVQTHSRREGRADLS